MFGFDVAVTTGQHDRLVVAATLAVKVVLEGPEVTIDVGTAKFVVKGGPTNRALQHDVQGAGDTAGATVALFPGLLKIGDLQVGDGKPVQAHLGLGTPAHGAFVPDFTTGTGTRSREGGNGRGVIVSLHLHQQVDRLLMEAISLGIRVRIEAPGFRPLHHRRVIGVGGQHLLAALLVGVLDHLEQAARLIFAVQGPGSVENLVAAMLGVRLGKHHQLDIHRIAAQALEALHQVIDLIVRQGQAQLPVGHHQRLAATGEDIHAGLRRWLLLLEQTAGLLQLRHHGFHHPIVQQLGDGRVIRVAKFTVYIERCSALQATNLSQTAVAGDIRRLRCPGRNGAGTGHHQKQLAVVTRLGFRFGAIGQQLGQRLLLVVRQGTVQVGKVHIFGAQASNGGNPGLQAGQEFFGAERRKCGGAAQNQHVDQDLRGSEGFEEGAIVLEMSANGSSYRAPTSHARRNRSSGIWHPSRHSPPDRLKFEQMASRITHF